MSLSKQTKKKERSWSNCYILVHNFWVTIVALQFCKDVIGIPAAKVAEARLDPHHLPSESSPVWTLKLHVDGL